MTNTLNDVIKVCEEIYGLQVNDKNRTKYVAFLKRQLKAHPEYDLNERNPNPRARLKSFLYFNLMRNKLQLFSYLIDETPIIAGYKGRLEEKRIKSIDDLYLLRGSELGGEISGNLIGIERSTRLALRQTDLYLLSLYRSFINFHHKYIDLCPNWGNVIDELGRDKGIVKYFGQKITYEMVKKCESQNPLTFSHGGDRKSKKFKARSFSLMPK